ncbi:MAG: 6,7-dimethyl-8-ribityllumazine synthase [Gammaproteobacteria bacterium]|nr:6,7-dimethyl-8-ribityllumazine synthase [Gammaproteobacteria bacterium]
MQAFKGAVTAIKKNIAIVVSEFNHDITQALLDGALLTLRKYLNEENIRVIWVPGAVEIAFAAQHLARQKKVDAIIALGAIIYGETDHYQYVCQHVTNGCQRVMLDESIPVIFGVLTVQSRELALARAGGKKGHVGVESAEAAIKMLNLLQLLDEE